MTSIGPRTQIPEIWRGRRRRGRGIGRRRGRGRRRGSGVEWRKRGSGRWCTIFSHPTARFIDNIVQIVPIYINIKIKT